jgi:anti-sigma regulatory factor (Ser/Thr protein kinase)
MPDLDASGRGNRVQSGGIMTDTASDRNRDGGFRTQAWTREFPARPEQVGQARKFLAQALEGCPVSADAVLCLSELASNSVIHSSSRRPRGAFTVYVEMRQGGYVHIEVHDEGGPWHERSRADGRPHGLAIVRHLAADFGIEGNALSGWIVWARLDWRGAATPLTGDESTLPRAAAQVSGAASSA